MKPDIRPGNIRDLTYIAANARDHDRSEVMASALMDGMAQAAVLCATYSPDWYWTAWRNGQPQAGFGISQTGALTPHIRSAWCFGTNDLKRCIPEITRFCVERWPQALIDEGVRRVEIRALADHDIAHKWLEAIRAKREGELRGYGVNGETFALYSWTDKDWA